MPSPKQLKLPTEGVINFARFWSDNVADTIELAKDFGFHITPSMARMYMRHPSFVRILRERDGIVKHADGTWSREDMEKWLTRIAAGLQTDGHEKVTHTEPIVPGENDYDEELGGSQFRRVDQLFAKPAELKERMKAVELLARMRGLFVEKVQLEASVSVTELLDDDLKHAKRVVDAQTQVVDKVLQVVDKREGNETLEGVLS